MATAKFVRTSLIDSANVGKAAAVVEVDGVEVVIEFWYDLIDQWGKEGTKQYLCAEALWQTGNQNDAIALLQAGAKGSAGVNEGGEPYDTRNWQQNWIDNHKPESQYVAPEIDPLA